MNHLLIILCIILHSSSLMAIIKKSTRLPMYVSTWSQDYKKKDSWDQLSPNLELDKNSFKFLCPAQSFLVGIGSKYENGSRRFQFACNFFENEKGELLSKSIKNCDTEGWDNKPYSNGKSNCGTERWVGGINGLFTSSQVTNTATRPDQQYKALCCTPETPDKTALKVQSCGEPIVLNTWGTHAELKVCEEDTVIQEISSTFEVKGTGSDRIITFKCCKLNS